MQITKDDLALVMYGEITDQISRDDAALVDAKIEIAGAEVKSYLNRFDTATMFGTDWADPYLCSLWADVAAWHLCKLLNPNVNIEVLRTGYEDAIKYLQQVQKGQLLPDWPLRPNDEGTPMDEAGNIQYSSNPKRNNHY